MQELLEIQPEMKETGQRMAPRDAKAPVLENDTMRRVLRVGGGFLPYLGWLIPLVDRMVPRRDTLPPGLKTLSADLRNDLRTELSSHMAAIREAQADISPAMEVQQQRLAKLEEHATELNHSLTNLSEDQLDLADQVRTMAAWVRNSAVGALFLLALLFVLKLVQAIHGAGH